MTRILQRITFLRHGLTAPQQERRYCGHLDAPLAPEGRRQIARLRRRRAWPPAVFCSDLRRCVETAAMLLPGVPPRIRPEWREIGFGAWEGLTWEETGCSDPDRLRHPDFCFPRGETTVRLQARVQRGLNEVLSFEAEEVLVIAHQGSIAAAMTLLLDLPVTSIWDFRLPCGEIRVVESSGDGWRIPESRPISEERSA